MDVTCYLVVPDKSVTGVGRPFFVFAGRESGELRPAGGVWRARLGVQQRLQRLAEGKKERKNNPAQQLPQIVAGGGQECVDLVARLAGQMVTTPTVVAL